MKIAHHNKELILSGKWSAVAKEYEQAGRYDEAVSVYEKAIKANRLNEKAYDRLMILYRKLKEPAKELKIINEAIHAFQDLYKPATSNKRIIQLSRALQKSTGLADTKGNSLYEPGPLNSWKKRKKTVENLIKKRRKGV